MVENTIADKMLRSEVQSGDEICLTAKERRFDGAGQGAAYPVTDFIPQQKIQAMRFHIAWFS